MFCVLYILQFYHADLSYSMQKIGVNHVYMYFGCRQKNFDFMIHYASGLCMVQVQSLKHSYYLANIHF